MNQASLSNAVRALRGLACLSVFVAALPLAGCAGESTDDSTEVDSTADAVNGVYGVDYSWARPSPADLHAQGYTFAARYLSYDTTGKNLTAGEATALINAGLSVVSNWEAGADDALGGYNVGVQHAQKAQSEAVAAGMPAGRPIYFSVDFDASTGQQATLNAYMDGVASVIGRSRTGAYGGYYVIKRLFDAGKITWGWQTYAWSGGQWDPRAQLRQIQNGIAGGQLDKDQAIAADFGQWGAGGGGGGNPPPPSDDCSVHSDGKLYCVNKAPSAMYSATNTGSAVVNYLRSTSSWFDCWGTGALHAGNNTTWYHTLGDDNDNWGWLPAVDLSTTSAFDANPTAHGLKQCAAPLPPLPANCNVHSDGKLYCANKAPSAMYSATNTGSAVVNHLRSTSSWFDCWGTGALHAGGNTTWYHTLGDDNGNWGWLPGVDLSTPSTFDANPSAYGFKHCN
jgi:Domain of unknown function (DUF1906)